MQTPESHTETTEAQTVEQTPKPVVSGEEAAERLTRLLLSRGTHISQN